MTVKNYQNVPSNAIDSVEINPDTNKVLIKYKTSEKVYTYNVEDADTFEQQLITEIPYSDSPEEDDKSIGRFVSQSVNNGTLQLITE